VSDRVTDIWTVEEGIRDLPLHFPNLSVASVSNIREEWAARKAELGNSERISVFTEQLNREWAIETGAIENLYDIERGVTQTLIEQGFHAALLEHGSINKDRGYVLALLEDQKAALENLFAFVKQDRNLTTGYIRELHAMMTQSQPTTHAFTPTGERLEVELLKGEWKRDPNYPFRDGVEYRYCPPEQTASEMDRLVEMHQGHAANTPPEVEAAWLHHRFTQIHPFQDGNGRVARALASLVLIRAGLFPLVVPVDEKSIYLESLEIADRGNLRSLVLLVARRQEVAYRRATELLRTRE
jgi:Fic family protein